MTRQEEMLVIREKLLKEHPEITTAYELSPLMDDAGYAKEYWEWQLDTAYKEYLIKD